MSEKHIFDGSDYEPAVDNKRLTGQLHRIFSLMQDGRWRTLNEIAEVTGDPPASISAQLRHLRKHRFGRHTVNKWVRGEREKGLFEYQLIVNKSVNKSDFPGILADANLLFKGDTATLKGWVTKPRWDALDARLGEIGYRYQGKGVWLKEKQRGEENGKWVQPRNGSVSRMRETDGD